MADEKSIDESPAGDGSAPNPGGGPQPPPPETPGAIDPMTLSCSDLRDLSVVIGNLIIVLKAKLDDTPKFRFLQRRAVSVSLSAQVDFLAGIKDAMKQKGCK